MKKSLFLLATAALVLASCNNDVKIAENKTLGNEPQEIGFLPLSQTAKRIMSRSAIAGTTFPQSYDMMVSAYYNTGDAAGTSADYFEGIQFGYDGTTTKWKSEKGAKYYPLEGTLDFLAVASAGYNDAATGIAPTATWGESSNCAKKVVLTVPANNGKFDDLLYGAANAQALSATGTPMTFNHAMTSVVFNAKSNVDYDGTDNEGITINSITIKNAKQTGTLTISNPSAGGGTGDLTAAWSGLGGAADVAARVWDDTPNPANASEPALTSLDLTTDFCTNKFGEGYVIIPPQDAVSFVIDYTLHNGKDASGNALDNNLKYTYTPVGTWDMGKKNIYNITFTLTEIMIIPEVVDWDAESNVGEFVDIPSYAIGTNWNYGTISKEAATYKFFVSGLTGSSPTVATTGTATSFAVAPTISAGVVTFGVSENTTASSRGYTIVVSDGGSGTSGKSSTITFTQAN